MSNIGQSLHSLNLRPSTLHSKAELQLQMLTNLDHPVKLFQKPPNLLQDFLSNKLPMYDVTTRKIISTCSTLIHKHVY